MAILGHDRCIPRAGPYAELSIYGQKSKYQHPKAHPRFSGHIENIDAKISIFFLVAKRCISGPKVEIYIFRVK